MQEKDTDFNLKDLLDYGVKKTYESKYRDMNNAIGGLVGTAEYQHDRGYGQAVADTFNGTMENADQTLYQWLSDDSDQVKAKQAENFNTMEQLQNGSSMVGASQSLLDVGTQTLVGVGTGGLANVARATAPRMLASVGFKTESKKLAQQMATKSLEKAEKILTDGVDKTLMQGAKGFLAENTTYAGIGAVSDMTQTDSIGEQAHTARDLKSFGKAFAGEFAMGTAPELAGRAIGSTVSKIGIRKNLVKQVNSADAVNVNLGAEHNAVINKSLLEDPEMNEVLKGSIDNNGLIDLTGMTPEIKEMVAKRIKKSKSYAIKDGDKFIIKSDALGTMKGTEVDGSLRLDVKKSNLKDKAYKLKIGDKLLLEPTTLIKAGEAKATKADNPNASKYHELESYEFNFNDKGDFSPVDKRGLTSIDDVKNKKDLEAMQSAIKDHNGINTGENVKTNVVNQILTAKKDALDTAKLPEPLKKIVETKNKINDPDVSLKSEESFKQTSAMSKEDSGYLSMFETKSEPTIDPDTSKPIKNETTVTKVDFNDHTKEAIKTALVQSLESKDTKGLSTDKLYKKIAQKTVDLLGIDTKNVKKEHIVKQLAEDIKKLNEENGLLGVVKDTDNVERYYLKNYEDIDGNLARELNEDFRGYVPAEDKNAIHTSSKDVKIKIKAPIEKSKYDLLEKEANTPFEVNDGAVKDIDNTLKKITSSIDEKTGISTYILQMQVPAFRDMSLSEIRKALRDLPDDLKETYKTMTKNYKQELEGLYALTKSGKNEFYFDVSYSGETRWRYEGLINPQTKLGRYIFKIKGTKFDVSKLSLDDKAKGLNIAKRSYLELFGAKPVHMNDLEVNEAFNQLVKACKSGNVNIFGSKGFTKYDDGILNDFLMREVVRFADNEAKGFKEPMHITAELDGINNGFGVTLAGLGLTDSRVGIGSTPKANIDDFYTEFANTLNNEGLALSRGDVKTAFIALLNNATEYEASKSVARTILDNARLAIATSKDVDLAPIEGAVSNMLKDLATDSKGVLSEKELSRLNGMLEDTMNILKDSDIKIEDRTFGDILNKVYEKIDNFDPKKYKPKKKNKTIDGVFFDYLVSKNKFTVGKDIAEHKKQLKDKLGNEARKMSSIFNSSVVYDAIVNKKDIPLVAKEDFINILSAKYHMPIKSAVKKIFPKEVLDYRNSMKKVSKMVQADFAIKYHRKQFNKQSVEIQLDEFFDILNVKDESLKKEIKASFKDNDTYSMRDIIDTLGSNVEINSQIMNHSTLKSMIPYISNGYNKVPMIGFKGYAGYDFKNKENFGSPTVIHTFQPLYTISNDSSIMQITKTVNGDKPVVSLWDAFVGNPIHIAENAKTANDVVGVIYKDKRTNPYYRMEETINENTDNLSEIVAHKDKTEAEAINWLAEQSLRSRDKVITKEAITREKNKIEEDFSRNSVDDLATEIKSKKLDVDSNKDNIKDIEEIAQYYNGNDEVKSTVKEATSNKDIPEPTNSLHAESIETKVFKDNDLKDVEPTEATFISNLSNGVIKVSNAVIKNVKLFFEKGAKSSDAVRVESMATMDFDFHEKIDVVKMQKLLHELTHIATDGTHNELKQFFEANIGSLTDSKGNKLSNGKEAEVFKEKLAQVVERLLLADMIRTNPSKFAKIFGTKDLKAEIDKLRLYDANGREFSSIYHLIDLIDSIADKDMKQLYKSQLDDVAIKVTGEINSNPTIIGWINKTKPDEFQTTIKGNKPIGFNVAEVVGSKMFKDPNKIANIFNDITELSLFETFAVNPKKEALIKAMALKDGFDQELSNSTAEFNKKINEMISKYQDENADKTLGNFFKLGLHNFANLFKDSKTSNEFISKINEHTRGLTIDLKNKIYDIVQDDAMANKIIDRFEKSISDLAYKGKSSPDAIAKKLIKQLGENPINNINKVKDLKDYVEMKATYYLINGQKQSTKTGKVHDALSANAKTNMWNESIGKLFSKKAKYDDFDTMIDEALPIWNRFKNNQTLFGANPSVDLSNRYLKLVPESKTGDIKKEHIVGTVYKGKSKYYVISKDKHQQYHLGNQESNIIDFEPKMAQKGIFRVKGKNENGNKIEMFLKPENIRTSNELVDTSFTRMATRNFYTRQYDHFGGKIAFEAFNILKQQGILITKEELRELPVDVQAKYTRINNKHPLGNSYKGHYFNKQYAHYINGTKGFDVYKMSKQVFGKDVGKFICNILKYTVELTKSLKTPILLYHMKTYINNFASNMIILGLHTRGNVVHYMYKAKKDLNEYKALLADVVQKQIDGVDYSVELKALEDHHMHHIFKFGLNATIRTDAYHLGTFEENLIAKKLGDLFGNDAGNAYKMLMADPSTKIGSTLGTIFDSTELYPKLALYLQELEKTGSKDLATQKVLMAFPTYYNLPTGVAVIDAFSPFTKYMFNIPKMALYAVDQNKWIGSGGLALMAVLPRTNMTWDDGDEKKYEWYMDNGFAKVDEDEAVYIESMLPFSMSSPLASDSSILDNFLAYNLITHPSNLVDFGLLTDLKKVRSQ